METAALVNERSCHTRTSSSESLDCGPAEADDIGTPHGTFNPRSEVCGDPSHTIRAPASAFAEDLRHTSPARGADGVMGSDRLPAADAAAAAAAAAAVAAADDDGNSRQPHTPVSQAPPAHPLAASSAFPGPPEACSDRSPGFGPPEACSDRSPAAILKLENWWAGYRFPFVEDVEKTWDNAVKMVEASVAGGFKLMRRNKGKLHKNGQEKLTVNRWSVVWLLCVQAGTPVERERVPDRSLRRQSSTKKVDCSCRVVMNWPAKETGPYISQVCLSHRTPETGEKEHEPPRIIEDENELTAAEVLKKESLIRRLHESSVDTAAIHKAIQANGKRLGRLGKQMVRNVRRKVDKSNASTSAERQQPTDTSPDVTQPVSMPISGARMTVTHEHGDVRATIYANSVAFGKEIAEMARELNSIAALDRVLDHLTNAAKYFIEVEVRSQKRTQRS